MESASIEILLDAWFEGNTTLAQEATLRDYFTNGEVPAHLQAYKPIFEGFVIAGTEVSEKEVSLPKTANRINPIWYSIAAMLVVAVTIGSIMFSNSGLSQEEKEALAAFKQTREVLMLASEGINAGTTNMVHLNEFTKGTSAISNINQFTKTKNKILK
jgi:hypothetical protein